MQITDCQRGSGKPTVRDERGACGNVGYGGTRHPPRISKERVLETLHLRSYAPYFYPTSRRRLILASCKAKTSQKYHRSTWPNTRRSSAVKALPLSRWRNASPSSWLRVIASGH